MKKLLFVLALVLATLLVLRLRPPRPANRTGRTTIPLVRKSTQTNCGRKRVRVFPARSVARHG